VILRLKHSIMKSDLKSTAISGVFPYSEPHFFLLF